MASSTLKVAVHPLVVMNMSDHYTRTKVEGGSECSVIGALLGRQSNRDVEVCNSFALNVAERDGVPAIDKEYLTKREGQYKEVFKTFDILGWYSVGATPPTARDTQVLQQLINVNDNPVFLKFDPETHGSRQPVMVYESLVEATDGRPRIDFVEVTNSTLATEEAERICVDHVATLRTKTAEAQSVLHEPMSAQHGAVKMLLSRVLLLLEYVKAAKDGRLQPNLDILREISSLCNQLPVLNTESLQENSSEQHRDVLLMSYLAMITKSRAMLNDYVTKFNISEERSSFQRRLRHF